MNKNKADFFENFPDEWEKMRKKLQALSLEELQELSERVGIRFTGGNKNVFDKEEATTKEQFIMVLDEARKNKLLSAYDQIIKKRKS
ncbi:MAG: hypothetical protein PHZ25_02310 [Candidatus Pacebacteria bacterium]|nr:hypothetical protein [Candidatus Paceibacterota bacterium]